jgi:nucleoside-diphosphate-sugar epimerase
MQPGDVISTYADVDDLTADVGFKPVTPIAEGLKHFINWYQQSYHSDRFLANSYREVASIGNRE